MNEDRYAEHREFERHSVDFRIEVSPADDTGAFCDKTALENISGGGVCFATDIGDRYSIGLKVAVRVFLPAIEDTGANMDCVAKVVWVHHLPSEEGNDNRALIGVCLDGFMSFDSYQPHDGMPADDL